MTPHRKCQPFLSNKKARIQPFFLTGEIKIAEQRNDTLYHGYRRKTGYRLNKFIMAAANKFP